ncbi:hypothetical protein GCM10009799_45450 [Nocardiopsis rhodophaea]|uniref:Uncharacterized protein n=1 Tax=Nocardiopsis rhodophaea TaxID=280238 RepID=A0ABN2TLW8_9ACTN
MLDRPKTTHNIPQTYMVTSSAQGCRNAYERSTRSHRKDREPTMGCFHKFNAVDLDVVEDITVEAAEMDEETAQDTVEA